MTMNMYSIPIEKNSLGVGDSLHVVGEYGLLQNYSKGRNNLLMMLGINYVYSFFYLDYHFTPGKFLST